MKAVMHRIVKNALLPYETKNELQEKIADEIIKCLGMEEIPESLILTMKGEKLIAARTINLIFGKTGIGKSSLTHCIVAAMLQKNKYFADLDLRNELKEDIVVLWLDTELFQNEFVKAMNKMSRLAERQLNDCCLLPFRMQSIPTSQRLQLLIDTVDWLTSQAAGRHVVVMADTITDLIGKFNDVEQTDRITQRLLDMVEEFKCTLVCVMHESKDGKAMGHLGSSMQRKSSSIIHLIRDDKNGTLRIKNTKNRNGKELASIYVELVDGPSLRLAERQGASYREQPAKIGRPETLPFREIDSDIRKLMTSTPNQLRSAIPGLAKKYGCTSETIRKRIKRILNEQSTTASIGMNIVDSPLPFN
jgi:hypothetical protein